MLRMRPKTELEPEPIEYVVPVDDLRFGQTGRFVSRDQRFALDDPLVVENPHLFQVPARPLRPKEV